MTNRSSLWFWIFAIAVTTTLIVSIAGNFIGYHYVHRGFDKYNDSRLDPLGELAWNLEPLAVGHHETVILGDSHASGWDYPGEKELNLGIGSQTSVQIKMRSDKYHDSLTGERLILIVGGNDLSSITTNLDRKDEIVTTALESIEGVVTNHLESFAEIVLLTVPPTFNLPLERRILHDPLIDVAHEELNAGIRRLAKKHGTRLVDAYALLAPLRDTKNLSPDGIHLNAQAYRYLEADLPDRPQG